MCVAVSLLALPAVAGAQGRVVELGVDGSLLVNRVHEPLEGADDRTITTFGIPVSQFRIGFLSASGVWSIEPTMHLGFTRGEGSTSTEVAMDLGVLYHFATLRSRPQPYLRPFAGVDHVRFSTEIPGEGDRTFSDTQPRFGLGLGTKLPIVDRLAARLEARLAHELESENRPAMTSAGVLFGLSFFTR